MLGLLEGIAEASICAWHVSTRVDDRKANEKHFAFLVKIVALDLGPTY